MIKPGHNEKATQTEAKKRTCLRKPGHMVSLIFGDFCRGGSHI